MSLFSRFKGVVLAGVRDLVSSESDVDVPVVPAMEEIYPSLAPVVRGKYSEDSSLGKYSASAVLGRAIRHYYLSSRGDSTGTSMYKSLVSFKRCYGSSAVISKYGVSRAIGGRRFSLLTLG